MKPIYTPKGRAREYCDLAVNIYTGCNHGCTYCYARKMADRWGKDFSIVKPRKGIVDALKKQLATKGIKGREIQLCFTCDPYPADIDTTVTREVIEIIKNSGNHVRILTKGGNRALRDFDLLDSGDWFGITVSGAYPDNEPLTARQHERIDTLERAKDCGIKTWVSCEPVIDKQAIYYAITEYDFIDVFKIGKLNYAPSDIDWSAFGHECERLCKEYKRNYYIKDDLRACMRMEK